MLLLTNFKRQIQRGQVAILCFAVWAFGSSSVRAHDTILVHGTLMFSHSRTSEVMSYQVGHATHVDCTSVFILRILLAQITLTMVEIILLIRGKCLSVMPFSLANIFA